MPTAKQKKIVLAVGVTAALGAGLYLWYAESATKTHALKPGYQHQTFSPAVRGRTAGLASHLPGSLRLATRRNEEFRS